MGVPMDRQIGRHKDGCMEEQTCAQTGRPSDRQADKWMDR
jgi:hypothetical protein